MVEKKNKRNEKENDKEKQNENETENKKQDENENKKEETQHSGFIKYLNRPDLLQIEKEAIGAYQDVHDRIFQKQNWSFEIPEKWKNKTWCYVINSFCRDPEFRKLLMPEETEMIEYYISHLDNAIQKSEIENEIWLFRGVPDLFWLKKLAVGEIFTEKAFGSFSSDLETAYKYTNPDNPIIFRSKTNEKMKALYVDETEYEILRPRNREYKITKIDKKYEKTRSETVSINKEKIKKTIVITIEEQE